MADGYERSYNRELGRDFELIRYGVYGPPLLVFPTASASAWQFQDYGLPGACALLLEQKRLQFFAVTGYSQESWTNPDLSPRERVMHHLAYERYVCQVLAPRVIQIAANDRLGAVGCGFGGYYALQFALKFPQVFKVGIALMGLFDLRDCMQGYYDEDFYFCNPLDYIPNLSDPNYLTEFTKTSKLALMSGRNDIYREHTDRLHQALTVKGIPHHCEVWDAPCDHHEYWWKQQLPKILETLY